MKRSPTTRLLLVGLLTVLGTCAVDTWAQRAPRRQRGQRPPLERPQRPLPPRSGESRPMVSLFERLSKLPPEERLGALESDEQFKRLSPEQQQRLRERLAWFSSLPPDRQRLMLERMQRLGELPPGERQRLRRRAERFEELSPEQRQQARRVFRAWQQLPPERRALIRERVAQLRAVDHEQQRVLLADPTFLELLTEPERRLLRAVLRLAPQLEPIESPNDQPPSE